MALGVQFKGREQVLAAFDNNGINTWALFTGKEIFTKGTGKDDLNAALELLEEGASNSVYTLRVYDDIAPKQVKSNTPNDGGFNFKLNAESMEVTTGQYQSFYRNNEMLSLISGMKKDIEEMRAEREQEPQSKLGMIGEILEHPVLGNIFEKIALKFIDNSMPAVAPASVLPMRMSAVGNLATDTALVQALEKLKQHDPLLTEHLQKLAILAEQDQSTFNIIVGALDKMDIK